ncbi:type 4a pilus biogenesis protein PilO [Cellulomonas sp. ACRRI]|uniref:type 4a pilus biogenesis protein PilO n=1 Tax=Cellulomonas sp. ACRRI TaxID=2918188 RepID=UPI001EF21F43|nr:type 4a pilus biogenesis protein PilO [Cellulomonas sp. ACRRI]MCG7285950.1 type 4a pilus biogenesis protein PilO [Cellulomonas sp. ACRRI]
MTAKTSTWVGGTAALAAVLMGGTFFLAVQPTLSRAAEAQEQTEITRDQNDVLRQQVDQLRADFVNLPQYQTDLADLRVGIPTGPALSDYVRELDARAQQAGLTITKLTPGAAEVVPGPTLTSADVAAATGTDPSAAPTAEATTSADAAVADPSTAAAAPATAAFDGFYAMPMTVTVVGTFPSALSFLDSVQAPDGRLLLVTSLVGTGQGDAEASGGRPATQEGDIELTIGGYLYVLTDPTAPADTGTTDETLPQGDTSGSLGSGS